MAAGPQPPLCESFELSHSPIRPAICRWVASELSVRPSAASTTWVPATAHHVSWICVTSAIAGLNGSLRSTGTRAGSGVGEGVGFGVGLPGLWLALDFGVAFGLGAGVAGGGR